MTTVKPWRERVHAPITVEDDQVWHGPAGAESAARLVKEGKAPGDGSRLVRWRFEDWFVAVVLVLVVVTLCVGVAVVVRLRMGG